VDSEYTSAGGTAGAIISSTSVQPPGSDVHCSIKERMKETWYTPLDSEEIWPGAFMLSHPTQRLRPRRCLLGSRNLIQENQDQAILKGLFLPGKIAWP
jgi:hypothetical protein